MKKIGFRNDTTTHLIYVEIIKDSIIDKKKLSSTVFITNTGILSKDPFKKRVQLNIILNYLNSIPQSKINSIICENKEVHSFLSDHSINLLQKNE